MERPEDICPESVRPTLGVTPLAAPLYLSSAYRCADLGAADAILGGRQAGYAYRRDGHPGADHLADKLRRLHNAEAAAITATGMAALAALLLAELEQGDHVVLSRQLYGATLALFAGEGARLGISHTRVDLDDLNAVEEACGPRTKLLMVETITNPMLRVADLARLAEVAHRRGVALVVDNTFASPILCRPMEWGADWVVESLTKIINGHSDVVLGCLVGRSDKFERVRTVLSRWGLASSPFDCWLAERGLGTLALRAERASANALEIATWLAKQSAVKAVHYPGLAEHPEHGLAARQLAGRFGTLVTFTLGGGRAAAEKFVAATGKIPFCPSLGEISTTLSHPQSTSHRSLSAEELAGLGIEGGTLRLSLGIESPARIREALEAGLAGLA